MPTFDIVILVLIALATAYGFFKGLIKSVGYVVSIALGIIVANYYYVVIFKKTGEFLHNYYGYERAGQIIIYFLIFSIVSRLIYMGFILVERLLNAVSILPGMKLLNRLLGGILGLFIVVFAISIIFHYVNSLPLVGVQITAMAKKSQTMPYITKIGTQFSPLIPDIFAKAKQISIDPKYDFIKARAQKLIK